MGSRIVNGYIITEREEMQEVKKFLESVRDFAGSRKFWVAVLGGALDAALVFIAEQPELALLVKLLTALGVWRVPNQVGAVSRRR